jgi:hypothetical protein
MKTFLIAEDLKNFVMNTLVNSVTKLTGLELNNVINSLNGLKEGIEKEAEPTTDKK